MKLTKAMKATIRDRAIHAVFEARLQEATAAIEAEAEAIMDRAGIIKLSDVPEPFREYINTYERFKFYCRGADVYVGIKGKYICKGNGWYQEGHSSAPCDEYPVVAAYKRIEAERSQYSEAVEQILASVGTLNQLAALSPALTAFCPDSETTNLPIPKALIDMVNSKLA